jgi:hypothetical protein
MSEIKSNEVTEGDVDFVDDFESPAESHRMAAYHFKQAYMQHELAASAYESGDQNATDMHAFIAYRHQLNAVQFAEIAVMEVQGIDEIEEIEEI